MDRLKSLAGQRSRKRKKSCLANTKMFMGKSSEITFEDCYLKTAELTVHYKEAGLGKPLILLHGGGLTSDIWEPHLTLLSSRIHVFAPDCRGHGRTNNPLETLNYQILAADLAEFIDHLGLEKPFVCGWSMGARTALEFGMRFPDVPEAIVCCGGGPTLPLEVTNQIIEEEKKLLQSPEMVEMLQRNHSSLSGKDYWKSLVKQLHELILDNSLEEYDRIRAPTLIICGDREERPGVEDYVALYKQMPQGELAVIPNSGHFSPIEDAEAFTNLIIDFFSRLGVKEIC